MGRREEILPLAVLLAASVWLAWPGTVGAAHRVIPVPGAVDAPSIPGLPDTLRLAQSEDPPAGEPPTGGASLIVDTEGGQVFIPGTGWVSEAAFWDIYLNNQQLLNLTDGDFVEIEKLTRPTD